MHFERDPIPYALETGWLRQRCAQQNTSLFDQATAVFGQNEYAISARARAGGVLKALVDGEASFSTDGTIKGDYPVPTTFTTKIVSNAETLDVTMVLDEGGNVKELTAAPPPSSDRSRFNV